MSMLCIIQISVRYTSPLSVPSQGQSELVSCFDEIQMAYNVPLLFMFDRSTRVCHMSLHGVGQVNRVESVCLQHKFIKRLPGYDPLDYKSRLMRLHTDSVELRRL